MSETVLLDRIFRDGSDPVVLIARDGTVKTANPAFRAVTVRGRDGAEFLELVSFHARERVKRELVRVAGGEEVLLEIPHPAEGRRDTIVEYRFFPVEGLLAAGLGRIRDMEKNLGEQLGRAKAELQQKSRMLDEIQMELTQVPFIDPVTGVWNRMQVIERLTGEWSRSERWGSPISCLMIDVEGISDLRRQEGNAVADEVLKAVARRIKSVVRDHDIVGRYGGARFVVVAVHSDVAGAKNLAYRSAECIQSEPVAVAGRTIQLKIRIGCCTNRAHDVEIMEDLFSVAEGALADARARSLDLACADEPT